LIKCREEFATNAKFSFYENCSSDYLAQINLRCYLNEQNSSCTSVNDSKNLFQSFSYTIEYLNPDGIQTVFLDVYFSNSDLVVSSTKLSTTSTSTKIQVQSTTDDAQPTSKNDKEQSTILSYSENVETTQSSIGTTNQMSSPVPGSTKISSVEPTTITDSAQIPNGLSTIESTKESDQWISEFSETKVIRDSSELISSTRDIQSLLRFEIVNAIGKENMNLVETKYRVKFIRVFYFFFQFSTRLYKTCL
jgi:hypothetical protein